MSNSTSSSTYRSRGRPCRHQTSPLAQSYIRSSDDESLIGSETDASSANSPPPQTIRHRRKASRIEDVNELNIDLLLLSPIDLSLNSYEPHLESKQSQTLPETPEPPAPPPKNSPTLQVEPLRITKRPVVGSVRPKLSVVTSPVPSMVSLRPVRLLVASVGNPKPYHSTRHSAGHHLLHALRSHLGFPTLIKSKTGLVAFGTDVGRPEFTLWQSTSLMNVSGKNLLQGWKNFVDVQASETGPDVVTGLVILHDELESAPGMLKVRRGDGSAKGHNGIKSIQMAFKGAGVLSQLGDKRYIRIGIGIGRPESRDRGEVSAYVLGQLTAGEKKKIDAKGEELASLLGTEVQALATLA